MNLQDKSIAQLAGITLQDWKKVNYAAKPYLEAMVRLQSINSNIGYDSGKSIILYFLSNASGWRGDVAKAVKTELKNRTK